MSVEFPYLFLLLLIPCGIFFAWRILARSNKKQLNNFIDDKLQSEVLKLVPSKSLNLKKGLYLIALLFLIIAMVNPRQGHKSTKAKGTGIDLVLAIDVSNSMLAQDIIPDRIQRTKQYVNKLLSKLNGDRVALVVFAGKAYIQMPLTTDYDAVRLFVNSVNTGIIENQGTAIAEALDLSIKAFNYQNNRQKAILLFTDGENHESGIEESIKIINEQKIKLICIGVGSVDGAPIPDLSSGKYKLDSDGKPVITKLNEPMLQDLANISSGNFVRMDNNSDGLEQVISLLSKIEKSESEIVQYESYTGFYRFFAIIALILLFTEYFIDYKSKNQIQILKRRKI